MPEQSDNNYGVPLKYDPEFRGPRAKRGCTDLFWLIAFIVFLCFWGYIGFYSFRNGDIDRLLAPVDSNGRKCGVDSEVLGKQYLLFFNISQCAKVDVPIYGCDTPQVCVEKCPTANFEFSLDKCNSMGLRPTLTNMICQQDVDKANINSCSQIETLVTNNKCAKTILKSEHVLYRCISDLPDDECPFIPKSIRLKEQEEYAFSARTAMDQCTEGRVIARKILEDRINKTLSYFGRYVDNLIGHLTNDPNTKRAGQMIVEDMFVSWKYIIIALLISIMVCLLFIALLRWIAFPIIWTSIIGLLILLGYGAYFSFMKFDYISKHPEKAHVNPSPNINSLIQYYLSSKNLWLYLFIILLISLVVIFLVVLVLRKRISIAIALVKEGSKAVSSVKSTVIFPIFPWILEMAVISFALAVGLSLASVGPQVYQVTGLNSTEEKCICSNNYGDGVYCDPVVFNEMCKTTYSNKPCIYAGCHFQKIENPSEISYYHVINIFGLFWGICFISAFGEMVLAMVFASWFWTFKKSDVSFFILTESFARTIRYHLGSLALGSIIIAICKFIRLIIEYIHRKTKQQDNEVCKAIVCCCRCFFWCLENFLKFLNTNAYIMVAIHGKSFCSSAKDAFCLLMRNALRVVALNRVAAFLFFISKVLISLGMSSLTYTFFLHPESLQLPALHYELVPAILVLIGTYLITSVFFGVYSMAVDTLFMCFLEDCERNEGNNDKPFYMSKELMKILHKKELK